MSLLTVLLLIYLIVGVVVFAIARLIPKGPGEDDLTNLVAALICAVVWPYLALEAVLSETFGE